MGSSNVFAAAFILASTLSLMQVSNATDGVDVSAHVGPDAWACLKKSGRIFGIIRCFRSTGSPDPNCPHTVYNAWDGGMSNVDVYFFPDFSKGNPAGQVQSMVSYLKHYNITNRSPYGPPHTYGMLWFDIEGTQYWGSQAANNQFIKGLLSEAERQNIHIGVYTSASQWNPITGGATYASKYPLWYAHYDGSRSFSDFSPFGGWTRPSIKQFRGDATVCGVGVDENWYP